MTSLLAGWTQVFILGFAAYTIGRFLLSKWISFDHRLIQIGAYAASGLLVISYALFGLLYTKHISFPVLYGFYGVLAFLAFPSLGKFFTYLRSMHDSSGSLPLEKNDGKWNVAMLMVIAIYYGWIWMCAALPATSVDEVIYHLAIPKVWLRHGSGVLLPNNIYSFFPQAVEMFFLFGLGTVGETAARLYHSLWGILLSLTLYGFARRFLSRVWSFIVVLFFLTIPSVMVIQSWAYVDLAYTLYTFLALIGMLQYLDRSKTSALVFSGVMMGGAFSVKYTGLQYFILIFCLFLWSQLQRQKRTAEPVQAKIFFVHTGILTSAFLIPAVPYLIRNWIQTGWPLFPFQVLGFPLHEGINWDSDRARLFHAWLSHFGTPLGKERIWHTLFAPILVFIRGQFDSIEFYDGILGPLFLLTPFLLSGPGPDIHRLSTKTTISIPKLDVKLCFSFSLAFIFYWAFTTKQIRFLIPIMPVICVLLAWALSVQKKSLAAKGVQILALILTLSNASLGVYQVVKKNPWGFWMGHEFRETYIARQLENYPFYRFVNQSLQSKDKVFLINMKNYGYFLEHDFDSDFIFERWRFDVLLNKQPSESQIRRFFSDKKITHLMIDEAYVTAPDWGLEPDKLARLKAFIHQETELVFRDNSYALYRLK